MTAPVFFDFTSLPGGETDGAASHRPPLKMLTASLPAAPTHTTALGGASPDETRATEGR